MRTLALSHRLALAFAALLILFGALVAALAQRWVNAHEDEALQRLSHGLARHIVEHWPAVSQPAGAGAEREALDALLQQLMVVNPAIEIYLLDADGRVRAYAGDAATIRAPRVDLHAVRAFLAGAALPLRGTDPKGAAEGRLFSAAMLPAATAPGYLYVVLDGEERHAIGAQVGTWQAWRMALTLVAGALAVTALLGWVVFRRLTQPLRQLALRMRAFNLRPAAGPAADSPAPTDEVRAIEHAFTTMAQRIELQARERMQEQEAHRETIANVAHDLRTPLTALHGHLEALSRPGSLAEDGQRHLSTALAQSERVRRLSQQLFELASLQSHDQVVHAEPVQLGELVTDAVQKFAWPGSGRRVELSGPAPQHAVLEGDPLLLERALTNLIDNALRHTDGPAPVRVWMESDQARVRVVVEDTGPGLPSDVAGRLAANRPLREPPLRRPADGFGGLGLAIAQRIAWLHGGILEAATPEQGGTRLALALPVLRL